MNLVVITHPQAVNLFKGCYLICVLFVFGLMVMVPIYFHDNLITCHCILPFLLPKSCISGVIKKKVLTNYCSVESYLLPASKLCNDQA